MFLILDYNTDEIRDLKNIVLQHKKYLKEVFFSLSLKGKKTAFNPIFT